MLATLALLLVSQAADPLARARALFEQRDFPAAERAFRLIATRQARLYLARTLIEQQRTAEALAELETALAGQPDEEIRFRAGEILRDLASRRLAALHRQAPDSAAVLEITGSNLERTGQPDEALRLYREAARRQPARPGIHYRIGALLWRRRELDAALEALRTELRLSPHHGMANLRLGQVLLARDEAEPAIAPLERAAAAIPGTAEPGRELGKAYRKVGRAADARRVFELTAKAYPTDDQIHFLLGTLYRDLGLTAEAQRELRQHAAILARRSTGRAPAPPAPAGPPPKAP
ncbi:MAG: tetratricopeptide repeat protein [Acidobacteria bacterium]|nr:tetratricopeptide repeat protein [Acidobacteriota bacterium]